MHSWNMWNELLRKQERRPRCWNKLIGTAQFPFLTFTQMSFQMQHFLCRFKTHLSVLFKWKKRHLGRIQYLVGIPEVLWTFHDCFEVRCLSHCYDNRWLTCCSKHCHCQALPQPRTTACTIVTPVELSPAAEAEDNCCSYEDINDWKETIGHRCNSFTVFFSFLAKKKFFFSCFSFVMECTNASVIIQIC